MKRIITISREFGSGGRELGKRLSDALRLPVYDHEIIEILAQEQNLCTEYIESRSEKLPPVQYAATIASRFSARYPESDRQLELISDQEKLIKKLACGDCIIVGRAADVLLAQENPFNIFVYADMKTKIRRCVERAKPDEKFSEKDLQRKIQEIAGERASYHALFSDSPWGRKESYSLCVNTSGCDLKLIAHPLAAYIENWFRWFGGKK